MLPVKEESDCFHFHFHGEQLFFLSPQGLHNPGEISLSLRLVFHTGRRVTNTTDQKLLGAVGRVIAYQVSEKCSNLSVSLPAWRVCKNTSEVSFA